MSASSATPTMIATATSPCPWRREKNPFSAESREFVPKSFSVTSAEFVPKSFSAKSREFVPKSFSSESREFVPSWERAQDVAPQNRPEDLQDQPFVAETKELAPKSFSEQEQGLRAKPLSVDSKVFVPGWKKQSEEQVDHVLMCLSGGGEKTAPSVDVFEFRDKSTDSDDDSDEDVYICQDSTSVPHASLVQEQTDDIKLPSQGIAKKPAWGSNALDTPMPVDAQVWPSLGKKPTAVERPSLTKASDLDSKMVLSPSSASIASDKAITPSTRAGSTSAEFSMDDTLSSDSVKDTLSTRSHSPEPSSEAKDTLSTRSHSPEPLSESDAATCDTQLPSAAEPATDAASVEAAVSPCNELSSFFTKKGKSKQGKAKATVNSKTTGQDSPKAAAGAASVDTAVLPDPATSVDAAVSQAEAVAPPSTSFDLHSLLSWRRAAPSQRPDAQITSAGEPEPDTPEAAIAAFAKAEAAGGSMPSAMPRESMSPTKQGAEVNSEPGWRRVEELASVKPASPDEEMWRDIRPVKKLEVSEASWVARQRARRSTRTRSDSENIENMNDEDVVRAMKLILNKLTVEKFESLSAQLMNCGIRTALHLEQLIQEVFEKATTQHHFIDMYADLCVLLNKNRIIDDAKVNFKKILLNCCQASFEKNLTPPSGLSALSGEDRIPAEQLYKTRMLGNIRFVGALLVRKMLASKVMLAIMEELLQDPTPEALESLAAFLMVVGPTFDMADWSHHTTLNAVFIQVAKLTKKTSVPSRVRCLLKDVIDVRSVGWNDRRPKKIEGPLKLEQVAAKRDVENSGGEYSPLSQASVNGDEWAVVGGSRSPKASSPVSKPLAAPSSPVAATSTQQGSMFTKARDAEKASKKDVAQEVKASKKDTKETLFDKDACRTEVSATLAELRVSHDVPDAIARIADICVPGSHQASEVCEILTCLAEDGSMEARKVGFRLVAGIFADRHWKPESAAKGLRKFLEDRCDDLKCDVPALPKILHEELHPALASLVEANLLDAKQHDTLMCA